MTRPGRPTPPLLLTVEEPETDPEPSITAKRRGRKRVPRRKLPHACQELYETSVADGETEDDVGNADTSCRDVVHGQDKRRRRERHETEWGRVGKLSVVDCGHAGTSGRARSASLYRTSTICAQSRRAPDSPGKAGWLLSMGLPPGVMNLATLPPEPSYR